MQIFFKMINMKNFELQIQTLNKKKILEFSFLLMNDYDEDDNIK
jgi:hypothetical protein